MAETAPAPGQLPHQGLISDVYWDERTDRVTFQLVERKRKLPRVFGAEELRAVS